MGNTTSTTDDQNGFYDRSLGTVTNGTAASGPHQLKRATITTGGNTGTLTAQYDSAGNMVSMYLDRNGTCLPSGKCAQVYKYEYDELNRLQRARRWDMSDVNPDANPLPTVNDGQEIVDLRYRYDADDNRIIKWTHDTAAGHAVTDAYTLYVFDSLDVRRAQFNTAQSPNEYELTSQTEVPYLMANGVRLARVVYEEAIPASSPNNQHVFFELGDHLGSTSTVLDKRTGELVEKATYQAYGGRESDFRPGRWADFREDWGFTGKEEDVEVGLVYFGKRYLNPLLGRWCSPDPLALHGTGGGDLNLYAYVRGMALKAIDPFGLEEKVPVQQCFADATKQAAAQQQAQAAEAKSQADANASLASQPKLETAKPPGTDMRSPAQRLDAELHAATTTTPLAWLTNTMYALTGDKAAYVKTQNAAEHLTYIALGPAAARQARVAPDKETIARIDDAIKVLSPAALLDEARAARDAAGLKPNGMPNRTSAAYVGIVKGDVVGVGASRPGGVHAEDDANAQLPGGNMTEVMGWRRNSGTGKLEWTPVPICTTCQGKYPESRFPAGTKGDPGGPWKK